MPPPEAEETAEPLQVLVVSDDDHVREEATFGFPAHVEVVLAEDAGDALARLEEEVPGAIIVSLRTGNSGGFALLADMSQREDLHDIPVLMLLEREQDRWLGRAGAKVCLTKPVDVSMLIDSTLALI